QVNAVGRGRRERAVPEFHKLDAAAIALLGELEYLFRLEIHKAQPHGALPHYAFKMPFPAASAEMFLGVERNHKVAAFPDTFLKWVPAEADTVSKRPDPDQPGQVAARSGEPGRHNIRVVEDRDRNARGYWRQSLPQHVLNVNALQLNQIG